jgi:hypothetical protein
MIEMLIYILILAIVVIVVFYVIDLLGLPAPIPMIAKLVIGLIVLLIILQKFLPAIGHLRSS